MLRITNSFRGEAPRVSPRALPDNAATDATNARLLTGDLTAWKQFSTTYALANSGPVETLYNLNGAWLSWDVDVDVARGIIPGDTTFRTYLTGLDVPRFTTYALATSGAQPYPTQTRILGVPAPDAVPTIVLGIDPTSSTFTVDTTDTGDVLATSWTTNPPVGGATAYEVIQDAVLGNPAPSYATIFDENHNPGQEAWAYRNFGVAGATILSVTVDIYFSQDVSPVTQANIIVGASLAGEGVGVFYQSGTLSIRKYTQWAAQFFNASLASVAAALAPATWYNLRAKVVLNSDNTKTVTASVYNGATKIAEVTVTNTFGDGAYCGFSNGTIDDGSPYHQTNYDNYHVQASGASGYVPVNLATSYVYTFVNDLGEESAPSLPSATVVRPDGVSATVTTPTGLPTGISTDYGITTKRIYRAATGNTGTAFLFVAEIPLAQADYVDVLTDAELGEVLPSSIWTLPPDDLRGILALPNGIMVGFRRNQLCFSAQNQPHAWPVQYRLNTDTYIVGIGNIDNTVVIGTESFVYIATGNDPAAYSMSKFEVPYACMSKRSFAYLTGIGVVFAGTNGLMAVSGPGQVRNLTDTVFTDTQWKTLGPNTVRGVAHNDIYWMFSETLISGTGGVAATLLEDSFAGTPGTLLYLHSPNIRPTGFVWAHTSDDLRLGGSGLINAGEAESGNLSGGVWTIPLTFPFRLELDATVAGSGQTNGVYVEIFAVGGTIPSLRLRVDRTLGGELTVHGMAGSTVLDAVVSTSSASHNYALIATETGFTLEQDSVEIGAIGVTLAGFDGIDIVALDIDPNGGSIQRIAVKTLSSPLVVALHAFAIDMKQTGFGVIPLGFHASAAYVQPVGDTMFLVLDSDTEPDDPSLPTPPSTPAYIDGTHVYEFEGSDTDLMTYRWRSKLWLLERPGTMLIAQVRAEDYTNLLFRVYADGVQVDEIVILGETEFTLTAVDEYATLQLELLGTSTVRVMQVAEDVSELS